MKQHQEIKRTMPKQLKQTTFLNKLIKTSRPRLKVVKKKNNATVKNRKVY